jgi:broad specificity phosphatase PhoE
MRRAIETATIMTGCPAADVVLDEECVERDYGALQGLPPDEVRRYADRVQYIEVGGIWHSLNPPGGESFEQVRRRAESFLVRVRARPERTAIVFSHQTFLQQLHGLLDGLGVIDSLALDIRTLQVDRFELGGGSTRGHVVLVAGAGTLKSW